MKRKIILDRSYAFYLISYLSKMDKTDDISMALSDKHKYNMLYSFNCINWASVLFEKILIEDTIVSPLYKLIGNVKWFWDIFEPYSPDKEIIDDQEVLLIIEDSLKLDMKDKNLKKIVRNNCYDQYKDEFLYESLILNINKTLQLAKSLDAAILPWPEKIPIYEYKFSNTVIFNQSDAVFSTMKNVFTSQIPLIDINNLDMIKKIRNDKRICSLRNKIWSLFEAGENSSETSFLELIDREKDDIINILNPDSIRSCIKCLVTEPIPFPFSLLLEGLEQILDSKKLKPYEWYFFLMDIKKFQERCLD